MQSKPSLDLFSRVETIGSALQTALVRALDPVGGPHMRPAHAARRLGMDTTAVWRVFQAATAPTPVACVHALPGLTGLSDFRRAVERHAGVGFPDLALAISRFEQLLEEFPAGRRGLNAAIEGWLPAAREKGLRSASQAASRAFSQLIGAQAKGVGIASILTPSQDGADAFDLIHVRVIQDLQRLRDGAELPLAGTHVSSQDPSMESLQITRPLGPSRPITDIRDLVIPEFGSLPPVSLGHARFGPMSVLTLPVGEPPVNESATVALGYRTLRSWLRDPDPASPPNWISRRSALPVRVAIDDLVVHRSIWNGGLPEMLLNLQFGGPINPSTSGHAYMLSEIPLGISPGPAKSLMSDLRELTWDDAPTYRQAVAHAFESESIDPADYVAFRVAMEHPVPMSTLTWFYKMPV